MVTASKRFVKRSRITPEISFASACTSAGASALRAFAWIVFHWRCRCEYSRSSFRCVSSSPAVRTITPPEPSLTTSLAIARRRERSPRWSILRLTPTWSESGM